MIRDEIEEIMISKEEIDKKVKEIGEKITNDYKGKIDELLVVGLLRGSVIFMADLVRKIDLPVRLDFMTVSSYGDKKESSREVKILKDLDENIMGKDILIVEDIIDSGLTLKEILKILKSRHPKSIKLCTLLDKPERREVDVFIDYNGFKIPDKFIVGYGLDFGQRYRNLPYIGILKGE